MEELRPDNDDLHPPAHVDGGDPDDWSKEDDPMVEDRPPSATETPAPSFEDMKDEAQSSIQSLQLEPKGKDKEMSTHEEDKELDEKEENKKRHLNVVFIGHVDAGKSTTGGQILFLSGQVDDRTIQKYEKEAKDKSRESWYMAYIMDTNEEERVKGKTVEVGRAHFETDTTRFTILDAPGHKSYVPNMISGASQADIGVLVISARKGEFETGYERGGQTREHVQLAKTLGVSKLLVVVNKMDDPTVKWSKERFDEIESKMTPFLRSSGYNVKKDVQFLPISGLVGTNMKTRVDKSLCGWWNGPCLFEALDALEVPLRDPKGPFRMPIIDKFKDMGTVVMGKIESGSVREGDSLLIMPNKVHVKVLAIYCDESKVRRAGPGENVRVKLSGIEDEDILAGFVLSSIAKPIAAVTEFSAQLQILELLDNAIFTAGYKAVLHIHAVVEDSEIVELLSQIDPKTKKPMKKKILFVKNGAIVVCRIQVNNLISIENFSDFPQLGRFTLRSEDLLQRLACLRRKNNCCWESYLSSSMKLGIFLSAVFGVEVKRETLFTMSESNLLSTGAGKSLSTISWHPDCEDSISK
ncbi:Translation elongation factor EF1A/initiation factor IF2gamma family protein isoform 1 [Cinnamomum micranthum f. kanehirae]|uniref:Translation elongation factor EF1A/initiation factor IF2gamma family protein isoform 1 n=1 Tax=Cinnamomum micranthum f. kanehirae TaxID=337451 RepID=A0A3S3MTY6_9MAGN|nr:Translation elongation factor EF1A/initiation factor IF2gamma family protein isoform 1 [Cinnamomum micranthum f. kanehirae]